MKWRPAEGYETISVLHGVAIHPSVQLHMMHFNNKNNNSLIVSALVVSYLLIHIISNIVA